MDKFCSRLAVLIFGWWLAPVLAASGWLSDLSLKPVYRLGFRRNWQLAWEACVTNEWSKQ